MKIFTKKKYPTGKREIYIFGIKIFSYINWKKYQKLYGISDYNLLPYTTNYDIDDNKYPIISIIYPVYYTHNNFEYFIELLKKYEKFSLEIKQQFEIIVIDDCSKYPISLPNVNLNITLLKINKDIAWNNSGARNLGACYASTPKIFLTDLDWFIPETTLKACIDIKLKNNDIIVFERRKTIDSPSMRVHPNVYCMNKKTFFNLNCYDEDFCGIYGEDLFYRKYIMEHGAHFININKPIIGENVLLNEHNLSRNDKAIKKKLSKMDKFIHKKQILKFPWEYVNSQKVEKLARTQAISTSQSRGGVRLLI